MDAGKAHAYSTVSLVLIVACMEVGIKVMVELCKRVLDGLGMSAEWNE